MERSKKLNIIKGTVFGVLCAAELYALISIIAYVAIWFSQPRFATVTGGVSSSSWGFLIQSFVFTGVFLLLGTAIVILGIKFFKKKQKKDEKEQKTL